MSLVDWLKGLTDRAPGADHSGGSAKPRGPAKARRPRKGGEAYAKEWVKVLEESGPDRDPFNTYTWELKPDATGAVPPRQPKPGKQPAKAQPTDPFDTYTWELHERDSAEDPWGLKEAAPVEKTEQKDGVNPYDTGVFDASWTGRFDQR